MTRTKIKTLLLAGAVVLAACGGGDGEAGELSGEELFTEVGCQACHGDADSDLAPTLHGLWGSEVNLTEGGTVVVDEAYVRKSIESPSADIVAGYDERMPTFSLSDAEIDALVDYVRSLG